MSRFPSDKHIASWAGVCPGNKQSGGKRLSVPFSERWLGPLLTPGIIIFRHSTNDLPDDEENKRRSWLSPTVSSLFFRMFCETRSPIRIWELTPSPNEIRLDCNSIIFINSSNEAIRSLSLQRKLLNDQILGIFEGTDKGPAPLREREIAERIEAGKNARSVSRPRGMTKRRECE